AVCCIFHLEEVPQVVLLRFLASFVLSGLATLDREIFVRECHEKLTDSFWICVHRRLFGRVSDVRIINGSRRGGLRIIRRAIRGRGRVDVTGGDKKNERNKRQYPNGHDFDLSYRSFFPEYSECERIQTQGRQAGRREPLCNVRSDLLEI